MKNRSKGRILRVILAVLVVAAIVIGSISIFNKVHFQKLVKMNLNEYIDNSVKHLKEDSLITIGIFDNGNKEIQYFSKNGQMSEDELDGKIDYEIGSINKTMTADIIYKLEKEGRLKIDDSIDKYLDLENGTYPTIKNLLTHTGSYKTIYSTGLLSIGNPMANFTKQDAINVINDNNEFKESEFSYSNFGYSTLGLIIENVTKLPYERVFEDHLKEVYDISNTKLSDRSGKYNNKNLFDWGDSSFYKPAGAAISNIDDMFTYLEKNLSLFKSDYKKYQPLRNGKTNLSIIKSFGIDFDAVSYGWLIDSKKQIWCHPGELPTSSAFIGFSPDKNIGVIVLINQEISNDVSAKFLGAKLLNELIGELSK